MPQLTPNATPVTDPLLDSDISHEICCIDEDAVTGRISMCGIDLDDGEIVDDDEEPSCIVCRDLLDRWAHNADAYGEDPHRPGDPPCRLCPRRHREGLDA